MGLELVRVSRRTPRFDGIVFIRALKFCRAGEMSWRSEVVRIADAVRRRVAVSRSEGTHASAAHEDLSRDDRFETPPAFIGRRKTKISPTH